MSLASRQPEYRPLGFPRVSGDEPKLRARWYAARVFSPRERG